MCVKAPGFGATPCGVSFALASPAIPFPIEGKGLASLKAKGSMSEGVPTIFLGVDSVSILFNHRSFPTPGVFPGFAEVF